MLIQTLFHSPLNFLTLILALAFALTVHEAAHAWLAFKLGDPTARDLGRLTLNPLAHLDLIGSLFLLFFGIGWGKPVPANPANLKNPRRDSFLISLAGPAANFLFAAALALVFRLALHQLSTPLLGLITTTLFINLILGLFNLIPIPPLDGSKILPLILPPKIYFFIQSQGLWILIFLFLLSSIGVPIFEFLIFYPSQQLFAWLTGLPPGFLF